MRIAVIMDPIASVNIDMDTSFALMLAAQARGHELFFLQQKHLRAEGSELFATVWPVQLARKAPPAHAVLGEPFELSVGKDLDAVLIRTDPPFDSHYLYTTLLLELVRGQTLVVNDPRGLRDANEKLYAMHFADVMPRTLVTQSARAIAHFVANEGGRAIIKPLDGNGGRGVMVLRSDDLNYNAIVEVATDEGRRPVMVQEFLPAVAEGDKRVLLLDGELLGAILRVPKKGEARSNLHVGGSAVPTELTEKELQIVARVAPKLRADGLYFVGLDMIGERLTEVNVTSPTGIQELSRFTHSDPEGKVIAWLEARVRAMRATP
ncbi:MAG: glutathione synthase [Deltaproteobacteria bacterium]|nr:glutathione synthase [Deltaproteobacteria bacterium]